jgi:hypothetical protein
MRRLVDALGSGTDAEPDQALLDEVSTRLRDFLEQARQVEGSQAAIEPIVETAAEYVRALLDLPVPAAQGTNGTDDAVTPGVVVVDGMPVPEDQVDTVPTAGANGAKPGPLARATASQERRAGLVGWALTRGLGGIVDPASPTEHSRALFDEWLLGRTLQQAFGQLGLDEGAALRATGLAQILLCHERDLIASDNQSARQVMETLLRDGDVRDFVGVNRYRDVLWFNQERFDDLIGGMLATGLVTLAVESPSDGAGAADDTTTSDRVEAASALAQAFQEAEEGSGYQLERLLRLLPA